MSTTPPIQYSGPAIDPSVPWEILQHIQLFYSKLGNHAQAMSLLQQNINKVKAGSNTTNVIGGGSGGGGTSGVSGIAVNNQSGQTSYATMAGDNLALIVFSDASSIAVSLTTQDPPWGCFATNLGTGTVTLTPANGTINGGGTLSLSQGYSGVIAFDGTNWFALTDILLAPLASPAFTGTPTAPTAAPGTNTTQIATTAFDTAAVAVETARATTAEALLAPKASPTFTGVVTQPNATVLTAATTASTATAGSATLPATPQLFLSVNYNGVAYRIPLYLP
jgi:hypothetical protein